jgi:uncharacterized membrane-anchored protein YhcB (DUF1043 family)
MNFAAMPASHMAYIPFVLIVGLVIGYMLGTRAVQAKLDQQRKRMKE